MTRAMLVMLAMMVATTATRSGGAENIGPGVPRPVLATECAAGNPSACYYLGESLMASTDGPADTARAKIAYEQACDLSRYVRLGCVKAGRYITAAARVICDSGKGPATGPLRGNDCLNHAAEREREAEAAKTTDPLVQVYFEKACQQGSSLGCDDAGNRLIRSDPAKARTMYARACALNSAVGCYNLAEEQAQGVGGPVNLVLAKANYSKSCDIAGTIRLGCDKAGRAPTAVDIAAKKAEQDTASRALLVKTTLACTEIARTMNTQIRSSNASRQGVQAEYDAAQRAWKGDRSSRNDLVTLGMTLNGMTDGTCVGIERGVVRMRIAGCPAAQIEEFRGVARELYAERKASQFGGSFNCRAGD